MPVRSDRLAGPTVVAAAALVTVFTVPAGGTWLVKRACATNEGVLTARAFWILAVGAAAGGLYSPSIAAGVADDHETWWAFDPGSKLQFLAPAANVMTISVFGAKLAGAA